MFSAELINGPFFPVIKQERVTVDTPKIDVLVFYSLHFRKDILVITCTGQGTTCYFVLKITFLRGECTFFEQ